MTYGELKIETLRIMDLTTDKLTDSMLDIYEGDSNFSAYLQSFDGAFNRCMSDIEGRQVVSRWYEPNGTYVESHGMRGYALKCASVKRVMQGIRLEPRFVYVNGRVYLPALDGLSVEYAPILERARDWSNSKEIDLPDGVLDLVPLFMKGELFRNDEPNEAAASRNMYEAGMEALERSSWEVQEGVEMSYEMR